MSEILIKQCSATSSDAVLDVARWLTSTLGKPKSVVFARNDGDMDAFDRIKWSNLYDKFMVTTGQHLTVYMHDPFKIVWYKGPGWEVFYVNEYYGSLELLTTIAARIDDPIIAVQTKLSCFV